MAAGGSTVSRSGRGGNLRLAMLAGTAMAVVVLGGCSVKPSPLTEGDRLAQVAADRAVLFARQEPVTGPITLEEAVARALKYNLDRRLAVMDAALQQHQLDVANYDMLPRLTASAGYTSRNREIYSISRDRAGVPSDVADATTSVDQDRATAELTLSWNILDFGVSYYQAKQQADRALIAEERRRRVVHSIVQQVRAAYWQAASAQRLQKAVQPVLAEARTALENARAVERQRLRPLLDVLRYQKALVEVVRQLETIEQDLAISKSQLAALMNMPPGETFEIAEPARPLVLPRVPIEVEQMETLALLNRPELREEAYQKRVTALEARKALLRLLPGLNLSGSLNYDSNSFLVNNTWAEAGTRVTWNLLNLLSAPAVMRVQEAQQQLTDMRRMALSMAALTQVHVGYRQYLRAVDQFERTSLLQDIEQRIYENIRILSEDSAERELERIRAGASAIAAELARDRAYADVQNSVSALYVSLGLDPLPEEVSSHDLPVLAAAVKSVSDDWMAGRVPLPPAMPEPSEPAPEAAEPAKVVSSASPLDFLRNFVSDVSPSAT